MISYRGRKFKKRMTKEELVDIAGKTYQDVGLDRFVQCKILSELCTAVNCSTNHRFYSLLSDPKNRTTQAWIRAYSLIVKFLEQYEMKTTLNTFNYELKGTKINYNFDFLRPNSPAQFLTTAVKNSRRRRKEKFSIRVSKFKIPPPVISTIEQANSFKTTKAVINFPRNQNQLFPKQRTNLEMNSYISDEEASRLENVSSIDGLADESFIDDY
ncbi:hypothetical protein TRFO_05462 [Tritrichomonas foetus]|uniref:Uncharacterized protein n=1 Tax=Tritrichomonas foetus TaxID=1144522 RepID=A0A1J4KBC4_9EUKA|nr:hypothetical protein TRFO_05462 [Tritrichomonas foetus]|eukprot:OHT06773.1 hypothetical protein TRFO_05462 [Tritrichomonas foetus]